MIDPNPNSSSNITENIIETDSIAVIYATTASAAAKTMETLGIANTITASDIINIKTLLVIIMLAFDCPTAFNSLRVANLNFSIKKNKWVKITNSFKNSVCQIRT